MNDADGEDEELPVVADRDFSTLYGRFSLLFGHSSLRGAFSCT